MESLNNIITNLTKVANTMGYTGPTVDAIIYLAANSIYNNEINVITAALEASASRCKLVNSAIQHAKDIGFSVNRGTNQHITINNMNPVESRTYKKYEQAAKIGNYYLYFARTTTVTSGQKVPIEFIVGKNVIDETLTVSKDADKLRLKSIKTNYSNDISFSKVNTTGEEELKFTDIKRNLFEVDSDINYWLTTSTDFGVEIYIYPDNLNVSNLAQFEADETYRLHGIEYLDDTIDISAIKTIPGFILNQVDTLRDIQTSMNEPRTEDPTKIYRDSMKSMDSSFVIRASDDIEKTILALNNSIKACNIIITPPMPKESSGFTKGSIKIYYLTKFLTDTVGISTNEKNVIINKLRNSYYVDHDFEFNLASGYRIGANTDTPRKYKLYLNVYYNNNINQGEIEEFINEYNYSIGSEFNPNKIIGDLVGNFDEISFVSFQKLINEDGTLQNASDEDTVALEANQFIDFELAVEYYSVT